MWVRVLRVRRGLSVCVKMLRCAAVLFVGCAVVMLLRAVVPHCVCCPCIFCALLCVLGYRSAVLSVAVRCCVSCVFASCRRAVEDSLRSLSVFVFCQSSRSQPIIRMRARGASPKHGEVSSKLSTIHHASAPWSKRRRCSSRRCGPRTEWATEQLRLHLAHLVGHVHLRFQLPRQGVSGFLGQTFEEVAELARALRAPSTVKRFGRHCHVQAEHLVEEATDSVTVSCLQVVVVVLRQFEAARHQVAGPRAFRSAWDISGRSESCPT